MVYPEVERAANVFLFNIEGIYVVMITILSSLKSLDVDGHCIINAIITYTQTKRKTQENRTVYILQCILLRRNGTPPLVDVLPFEINNENYFLLIGIIVSPARFSGGDI